MQVEIPEIVWHDETSRIMSLDFFPNSDYLVTASLQNDQDSGIRFWRLRKKEPEFLYNLQGGHDRTVNAVKFAPNGQFLASGADDQMVVIWQMKLTPIEFGKREESVQWGHPRQLRGHVGDVIDLAWSASSTNLVSCSLDGTNILWGIQTNKQTKIQTFEGHRKFVQGVSVDPRFKFISSQSSDGTVRVYKNRKLKNQIQFYNFSTLKSREEQFEAEELPQQENVELKSNSQGQTMQQQTVAAAGIVKAEEPVARTHRLYLDDVEYFSFFRRLDWSPDGNLMLTPSACFYDLTTTEGKKSSFQHTVYGFLRYGLSSPAFMLPGIKQPANCVKFCPWFYKSEISEQSESDKTQTNPDSKGSKEGQSKKLLDLPYKMIYAVATTDQVIIYSTDSIVPLAIAGNTHYAPINDMSWCSIPSTEDNLNKTNQKQAGHENNPTQLTSDCRLCACSSDGYVSIMHLSKEMLGERLELDQIPEKVRTHYLENLKVNFKDLERETYEKKSNQFMPVQIRKKINQNLTPNTNNVPAVVANGQAQPQSVGGQIAQTAPINQQAEVQSSTRQDEMVANNANTNQMNQPIDSPMEDKQNEQQQIVGHNQTLPDEKMDLD